MMSVVSVIAQYDTLFPSFTCKYLRAASKSHSALVSTVDSTYENTIKKFNQEMMLLLGTKTTYTCEDISKYYDSLYARKT